MADPPIAVAAAAQSEREIHARGPSIVAATKVACRSLPAPDQRGAPLIMCGEAAARPHKLASDDLDNGARSHILALALGSRPSEGFAACLEPMCCEAEPLAAVASCDHRKGGGPADLLRRLRSRGAPGSGEFATRPARRPRAPAPCKRYAPTRRSPRRSLRLRNRALDPVGHIRHQWSSPPRDPAAIGWARRSDGHYHRRPNDRPAPR
jgi:hypothetical protein